MAAQYFDIISTNIDILARIFQYLEFEDQLRLALVNVTLQHIFKSHIWRDSYQYLTIETHNPPNVIVYNEMQSNKMNLNAEQCKDFLRVYGSDIKSLREIKGFTDARLLFPQLTALSYLHVIITEKHLELVAENCRNLEKLELRYCSNPKLDILVMGRDVRPKTLLRMKMLRHFILKNTQDSVVTYEDLQNIIHNSKLQYLHLNAKIVAGNESSAMLQERPSTRISLEHLKIFTSFDASKWSVNFASKWSVNFASYLKIFENLTTLSLKSYDKLNAESLKTISLSCQRLQKLKLYLTTFGNIDNFRLPLNLDELSLYCCRGLSYQNLRQLLTQHQLKKFSSNLTKYQGTFQHFPVTRTLEMLDLDAVYTNKFPSVYTGNLNLKELTWYDDLYGEYDKSSVTSNFLDCWHLEKLIISFGHIPIESILQLKCLHYLTIPQSMPLMSWSYIEHLLRYSTITEMNMSEFRVPRELASSEVPSKGFKTCVKCVRIPLIVFNLALDFWLDIRAKSLEMHLECLGINSCLVDQSEFYGDLLKAMVNSSKFPKHLKSIQICGFNVDCRGLKQDYKSALAKINPKQARLRFPGDIFSIVL